MINGAKYPEFTAKVIVINTQCKFFFICFVEMLQLI